MRRIAFAGIGGQSVRVISHVLAMALKELGYEVALLFDYDSSIRNQRITAYLTYDRNPIENPMIDEADILVRLHEKGDQLIAQKTICDTGLCTDEEVPFGKIGIDFGLCRDSDKHKSSRRRILQLVKSDILGNGHASDLASAPGSVGQVRECAAEFLHLAKGKNITVFLLGHVTKEGDIAGPRVLEHIVDTVLYFEAERHYS
jgi:hypothetical protein